MKVVRYSLVAGAVGLGLALSPIMADAETGARTAPTQCVPGTVPAGLPGGCIPDIFAGWATGSLGG